MCEHAMYRWRGMSDEQRVQVMTYRKSHLLLWHSPPHYTSDSGLYLITASCYEHRHIIGTSPERMAEFEKALLDAFKRMCNTTFAWTVLPNHYHALVKTDDVKALLTELGRLHGRTSFHWNGEEDCRGRKVWFNAAETGMKSERHFWATLL